VLAHIKSVALGIIATGIGAAIAVGLGVNTEMGWLAAAAFGLVMFATTEWWQRRATARTERHEVAYVKLGRALLAVAMQIGEWKDQPRFHLPPLTILRAGEGSEMAAWRRAINATMESEYHGSYEGAWQPFYREAASVGFVDQRLERLLNVAPRFPDELDGLIDALRDVADRLMSGSPHVGYQA
jgi:hypothetical protein